MREARDGCFLSKYENKEKCYRTLGWSEWFLSGFTVQRNSLG